MKGCFFPNEKSLPGIKQRVRPAFCTPDPVTETPRTSRIRVNLHSKFLFHPEKRAPVGDRLAPVDYSLKPPLRSSVLFLYFFGSKKPPTKLEKRWRRKVKEEMKPKQHGGCVLSFMKEGRKNVKMKESLQGYRNTCSVQCCSLLARIEYSYEWRKWEME